MLPPPGPAGPPYREGKKGVSLEGNHQMILNALSSASFGPPTSPTPFPVVPSQLPVWPEWYPAPSPLAA